VGFADGTGLVEGPTRIAATNVWTYTFAVLAPFGTLSHASVLDQLEAGLAGALVGADAHASAAAALAEEFALIGVPVEGKSATSITIFMCCQRRQPTIQHPHIVYLGRLTPACSDTLRPLRIRHPVRNPPCRLACRIFRLD
jgi:hypothetical protein